MPCKLVFNFESVEEILECMDHSRKVNEYYFLVHSAACFAVQGEKEKSLMALTFESVEKSLSAPITTMTAN